MCVALTCHRRARCMSSCSAHPHGPCMAQQVVLRSRTYHSQAGQSCCVVLYLMHPADPGANCCTKAILVQTAIVVLLSSINRLPHRLDLHCYVDQRLLHHLGMLHLPSVAAMASLLSW